MRITVTFLAMTALAGCGGGAPPPVSPPPASLPPAPAPTPPADPTTAPPPASVVRFDDVGVSFAVPAGFRVLGDDDIARRVRSASGEKLRGLLADKAAMRKGIPLLALSRSADPMHRSLDVTVSLVAVPADASAVELLEQQRKLLAQHADDLEAGPAPSAIARDGVPGAELRHGYSVGRGERRRVQAILRVYVRSGLAVLATAVWPDVRADEDRIDAESVLDALRLYPPTP